MFGAAIWLRVTVLAKRAAALVVNCVRSILRLARRRWTAVVSTSSCAPPDARADRSGGRQDVITTRLQYVDAQQGHTGGAVYAYHSTASACIDPFAPPRCAPPAFPRLRAGRSKAEAHDLTGQLD